MEIEFDRPIWFKGHEILQIWAAEAKRLSLPKDSMFYAMQDLAGHLNQIYDRRYVLYGEIVLGRDKYEFVYE